MIRFLRSSLPKHTGLLHQAGSPLMRLFSTEEQREGYHPVKKIDFQGKSTFTVLSQPVEQDSPKIPYQIKETTFKNAVGVTVGFVLEFVLAPSLIGPLVISGFCTNWIYQVTKRTFSSVVTIQLSADGSKATFTTLLGEEYIFNVQDIEKVINEKELVETYDEPAMYPVKVEGRQFYLLVNGQESIRDGELFRAIVNGRRIQF